MKIQKVCSAVLFYALVISIFLGAAYLGSAATSVVAQRIPVDRMHTVVIDAGHGGEDGGASSCTGKLESGFNLEISTRLNDLLHFLGYNTVMIRTTDQSVYTKGNTIAEKKVSDLKRRVEIVQSVENALLVSIHQNHFPESQYSGAQVFYAPNQDSRVLAEALQAALIQTVNPGSRRACKKSSGVYLMEHISCPGVLVECGFLSNPQEEAKLQTPDYQKKLCCVIASCVGEYLKGKESFANA